MHGMKRWFLCVWLVPVCLSAQVSDRLESEASADLQKALADLAAARQAVEAERLPLAQKLSALEQTLAERRAEFAHGERLQENQLVELNALKAEARLRSEEVKYIDSLLSEYTRAFRSRIHFIEEPRYRGMFEAVGQAESATDLSPADRLGQRSVLLTTALDRAAVVLGGDSFEGQALDKEGRVQRGKAAIIGPVAMFASTSGDVAGLLQQELNKADPTIVPIDRQLEEASRALVTTGKGRLALDATLGNAFKLTALQDTFYEKIAKGGLAMIPLILLGVSALLVALVKWLQLSRVRLASDSDLQAVLRDLEQRDPDKALARARGIRGPVGDLLAAAVEHVEEKKEYIEEIAYEKILGARTRLERGLPFLALAATAGPLMGLLGTVMGMIATFKLISSFGSGDPRLLAAGISEALIATATGMVVAIPSLLLHAFLSRRAKGIIGRMEQVAVGFINGLPEPRNSPFA